MTLRGVRATAVAVVLLVSATQRARADVIVFNFSDPSAGTISTTGNDGFLFQPTVPIRVTALGYYDRDQDGLALDHPVGIYDAFTQTLLASTTAGPTSTLDGLFRFNPIAPLALNPGQSYVLVGFHPGSSSEDLAANTPTGLTIAPQILYQGYFYSYDPVLTFPTVDGSPATFFGPNMQVQVPEPTGLALLGCGLLAAAAAGWRRRIRNS